MTEGDDEEESEEENGLVALEGEREATTLQQGRIPFMDRFGKWSSKAVGSVYCIGNWTPCVYLTLKQDRTVRVL